MLGRKRKQKLEFVDLPRAKKGDLVEITLFEGIDVSDNFLNPSYLGFGRKDAPGKTIQGEFLDYFKTKGSFGKRPGKGLYLNVEGLRDDNAAAMVYHGAIHSYKVKTA